MKCGKKKNPVPINESDVSENETEAVSGLTGWARYGPTLRFSELLEVTNIGRSKAYEVMNPNHEGFDPGFPAGFPLFDSPRSPKIWWTHLVAAWIEGRAKKHLKP